MSWSSSDIRQISPHLLVLFGIATLGLLTLSFLLEVRIIVTTPKLGDISRGFQTIWRVLFSVSTIASFLLAGYNALTADSGVAGPATTFEIKGDNHDIDFHLDARNQSPSVDTDEGDPSGERPDVEPEGDGNNSKELSCENGCESRGGRLETTDETVDRD